jgi:ATPase subunit of ABC transporter with duplicated ATPase domains
MKAECYLNRRNFTQFYSTKSERDLNLRKEYDNQMEYRKHLQAFIDRWRYNANRGMYSFVYLSRLLQDTA